MALTTNSNLIISWIKYQPPLQPHSSCPIPVQHTLNDIEAENVKRKILSFCFNEKEIFHKNFSMIEGHFCAKNNTKIPVTLYKESINLFTSSEYVGKAFITSDHGLSLSDSSFLFVLSNSEYHELFYA